MVLIKNCSIPECKKKSRSRGWCASHYEKWRRFRDPLHVVEYDTKHCSISGCNAKHDSKGYCIKHYTKWKKYGDPLHIVDPKKTREKMRLSHLGKKDSAETRRKKSVAGKGRKITKETRTKISRARKGHVVSKETRAKISKSNKNPSEETRAKISKASKGRVAWNKGKPPSEEHKKNMAESRKGRKLSEEHKKNIGKAGKGRKITEETREKMSKVQTGKIISEDQKKKMSEIHSTPKMKQIHRARLRKTRHNQQKPNKQELEIKKILTNTGLIFNPEQNLNKFIQSSNESNFGMFVNIPFSHSELQQKFKETDFLIPPNKIIEHNGTYDHADPRKYSVNAKIRDTTAGKKWKKEEKILDSLKKEGYEILVIWQMDLEKNTENIAKKILKFVKLKI